MDFGLTNLLYYLGYGEAVAIHHLYSYVACATVRGMGEVDREVV